MSEKRLSRLKFLIIISLISGIFLTLGITGITKSFKVNAESNNDALLNDNEWNENLYVNYDMRLPENVSRNSVIAGSVNTNGVNADGLHFVTTINQINGSHYRGTTGLKAGDVVVYVLKNPVEYSHFGMLEFKFYTEGNLNISCFSGKEKILNQGNSLLDKTITGETSVFFNSKLFAGSDGLVKSITLLINSNSDNSKALYLDGITLRTGGFNMLGASVRLKEPTGLGFGSAIDTLYYNRLIEDYGTKNVKTGTIITRSDFVTSLTDLTMDTAKKINVKNRNWLKSSPEGKHVYRGSMVGIPEAHFSTEFIGRGYIEVNIKGNLHYIYNEPVSRAIAQVAMLAYHEDQSQWTESEKEILRYYAGGSIIKNREMNYSIIIPAKPTPAEETAGEMLSSRIEKASKLNVKPVVTKENTTSYPEKAIYIGDTVKEPDNLVIPAKDEAYAIKKDYSGNVYIRGNSSRQAEYKGVYDRGTLYGVYDFLEKYFGYRFINVDEDKNIIETYKDVPELYVMEVKEETFAPSIDIRAYSAYNINFSNAVQPYSSMLRHNTNLAKSSQGFDYNAEKYGYTHQLEYYAPPYHNSYDTLKAGIKIYNDTHTGTDLTADQFTYILSDLGVPDVCMAKSVNVNGTTVSSADIIALAIKSKINGSYPYTGPLHYYVYGQEDSHDYEYCNCSKCNEERAMYGGASGQLVHFCNEVIAKLESDNEFIANCPDFKLITFAYSHTKEPPTVASVKADEKLIIRLALHQDDYYGVNSPQNNETSKRLADWQSHLGGGLMLWIYDSDFQNYAGYYPTINRSIADNVKAAIDHNAEYLMVNSSGALNDWDSELRLYIYSNMMYHFDEDKYNNSPDGYVRELATEYVNGYFGANNVTGVMDIIDKYQKMYEGGLRNFSRRSNNTLNKNSLESKLKGLKGNIETLINNETNPVYKKRLKLIKISVLADLYDTDSGYKYRNELISLCNECNFTQWSEGFTVSQKLG